MCSNHGQLAGGGACVAAKRVAAGGFGSGEGLEGGGEREDYVAGSAGLGAHVGERD